ncbi:MAG: hypothetical protein Q4E75_05010 [bacterium]|nr:hypothetical protein [bacterium]
MRRRILFFITILILNFVFVSSAFAIKIEGDLVTFPPEDDCDASKEDCNTYYNSNPLRYKTICTDATGEDATDGKCEYASDLFAFELGKEPTKGTSYSRISVTNIPDILKYTEPMKKYWDVAAIVYYGYEKCYTRSSLGGEGYFYGKLVNVDNTNYDCAATQPDEDSVCYLQTQAALTRYFQGNNYYLDAFNYTRGAPYRKARAAKKCVENRGKLSQIVTGQFEISNDVKTISNLFENVYMKWQKVPSGEQSNIYKYDVAELGNLNLIYNQQNDSYEAVVKLGVNYGKIAAVQLESIVGENSIIKNDYISGPYKDEKCINRITDFYYVARDKKFYYYYKVSIPRVDVLTKTNFKFSVTFENHGSNYVPYFYSPIENKYPSLVRIVKKNKSITLYSSKEITPDVCISRFSSIINSNLNDNDEMEERIKLYEYLKNVEYPRKNINMDPRNLLNLNITDPSEACVDVGANAINTVGCLSASLYNTELSYTFNGETKNNNCSLDSYNSQNISCYNELAINYDGSIAGYCYTNVNLENLIGTDFFGNVEAGSSIIFATDKSLVNNKYAPIGANIYKKCYFPGNYEKSARSFSFRDKDYDEIVPGITNKKDCEKSKSQYFVKENVGGTCYKRNYTNLSHYINVGLGLLNSVKTLSSATLSSDEYMYDEYYLDRDDVPLERVNDEDFMFEGVYKYKYNTKTIYSYYGSGKTTAYSDCTKDGTCYKIGSGLVSNFNDVGEKNFEFQVTYFNYNNGVLDNYYNPIGTAHANIATISSNNCSYNAVSKITGSDSNNSFNKLNLQFEIIDTSKPFAGKNGLGRQVGSNWCDGDNCYWTYDENETLQTNSLVQQYIINANNSSNKTGAGAIYTIMLDSSKIKNIRDYNKEHPYDEWINCGKDCDNETYSKWKSQFLYEKGIRKNIEDDESIEDVMDPDELNPEEYDEELEEE